MVRNIAYFPSQCAKNAPPVLEAFARGCALHGIELVANSRDAAAAMIWSVLWHGRMQANREIYQHYRSLGRPVICMDIGALDRGRTWKIALNNITRDGYYGHEQDLDPDRPAKLGICIKTPTRPKPAVLIALQHPRSLQVQGVDQVAWAAEQIKKLRQVSDLPILIRQHPRGPVDLARLKSVAAEQVTRPVAGTYDSFDIDYGYRAVINYNSGVGVQAAMAGAQIRVDATSLAAPISIDLTDINSDHSKDRSQWLIEISHTEYLIEEIAQGTWLKRIGHQLVL